MYEVKYASTRGEIWRWYWCAWARPRGLWRFHVIVGLLFAIALTGPGTSRSYRLAYCLAVALASSVAGVAVLCLWPRIRFKAAPRSLTIDENGLKTTIGQISGSRRWSDVRSVVETDSAIVITGTNGNVLIVPSRAFATERERLAFYNAARRFHGQATAYATKMTL
ncbi:MAG: YcxB family protein [Steroidobacteraceae bacterium]